MNCRKLEFCNQSEVNMKKRIGLVLMVLLCCFASLFANGAAEEDDGKILIGVSMPTMTHPIRKASVEIIDEWLLSHPNVEVVVTDGQLNANKQIADIEDLIARQADVIMVAAHQSPTLVSVLQQAKDAGIAIIAFDRTLTDPSVQISQVINDDYLAGKTGAELIVEGMGETGKVAIIEGTPGAANTVDRQTGFMDEISKYPGIEIVADLPANFQRVQAVDVFENILQANPDITGVYCHNDEMALGVCKVLKDAVESRAITPQEFSAERDLIIEALLPPNPRQRMQNKIPSRDVMGAAKDLRKLEILYDLNLITAKEKAAEKAAIEKYLGINRAPAKKAAAKKVVKPAAQPCTIDNKSAPCTLTDKKTEVKETPEKELVKTEIKVIEEVKNTPVPAPAAPQKQSGTAAPQPLIPAVSSPFNN